MTVSSTIEIQPTRTARIDRLASRLAHAAIGLVAFALLAGVWLAYFTIVPFDFTVR
jgi:hypothetical protein